MGLHFRRDRLPELARKLAALGKTAGYEDLDAYLRWLMGAPLQPEQTALLAAALTVGETYFLRDPKSYQVFEKELLPGLLAARRCTGKSIRIWSAGCSSGEEPYSIAILLHRVLPDLGDWKITLIASDINPQALERGRQGIYSKWSFRNAPAWLMEYFSSLPDGRYQIAPHIREMVRFIPLNLAAPGESATHLTSGMDVIFCRNVMLYFHQTQIEQTVARFHAALNSGGWLFVGPTEVNHGSITGFTCRHYDGALVLRKSDPAPETADVAPVKRASTPVAGPIQRETPPSPAPRATAECAESPDFYQQAQHLYQEGRYKEAALLALDAPDAQQQAAPLALAARCYANLGQLEQAREYCERTLALERLSAANHYLLSIILEQQGDTEGAVASLRRALYIDHDYLLAWFALGNLCRQRGESREAEQSFGNALRLLQRMDPNEALPEADGITAGSLAQIISSIS